MKTNNKLIILSLLFSLNSGLKSAALPTNEEQTEVSCFTYLKNLILGNSDEQENKKRVQLEVKKEKYLKDTRSHDYSHFKNCLILDYLKEESINKSPIYLQWLMNEFHKSLEIFASVKINNILKYAKDNKELQENELIKLSKSLISITYGYSLVGSATNRVLQDFYYKPWVKSAWENSKTGSLVTSEVATEQLIRPILGSRAMSQSYHGAFAGGGNDAIQVVESSLTEILYIVKDDEKLNKDNFGKLMYLVGEESVYYHITMNRLLGKSGFMNIIFYATDHCIDSKDIKTKEQVIEFLTNFANNNKDEMLYNKTIELIQRLIIPLIQK